MNPNNMIPVYNFDGEPAFILRSQLIKMCSTFEVSSMIKAAKSDNEYDGLLDIVEKGGFGLNNASDGKLSKIWEEIRELYETYQENGDLISDDVIEFLRVGADEVEVVGNQINLIHALQTHDPKSFAFELKDWQPEDEISTGSSHKVAGKVELKADSADIVIAHLTDQERSLTVSVELQNDVVRVRNYTADGQAPLIVEIPFSGPINVDRHDYDIEASEADTQTPGF